MTHPAYRRHLIIHDSNGSWARALRRFLPPEFVIFEPDWAQPDSHSDPEWTRASLFVVNDVEQDAARALSWARRSLGRRGSCLKLAVVRPAHDSLAWRLREFGVAMVWDEFWQVPTMARMIVRFWHRLPLPDLSAEERLWNNLPWNPADPTLLSEALAPLTGDSHRFRSHQSNRPIH